jgi:PAS domain S-box-containing protein
MPNTIEIPMLQAGHVLIDEAGLLVSIDQGFCGIMRADAASMIGRRVRDVTAPADRRECETAIANLVATRKPFRITKRFLRDDGTLVWVANSVSIVEGHVGPNLIVATVDPVGLPVDRRAPARLLECARLIVACKIDRSSVLDRELITDTAWDAMLAAYIAEAEGRVITPAALAAALDLQVERAARWIDILLKRDIVEIEMRGASPNSPKAFRLTAQAHRRLETHLANVNTLREAGTADSRLRVAGDV